MRGSNSDNEGARRVGDRRRQARLPAVGRVGPFKRALHIVLDVTEEAPRRISFVDVGGSSFTSYAGAWTLDEDVAGTRVTYVLEAWPRSSPPLFGRSILASNARGLLEQVRDEMLRREAGR